MAADLFPFIRRQDPRETHRRGELGNTADCPRPLQGRALFHREPSFHHPQDPVQAGLRRRDPDPDRPGLQCRQGEPVSGFQALRGHSRQRPHPYTPDALLKRTPARGRLGAGEGPGTQPPPQCAAESGRAAQGYGWRGLRPFPLLPPAGGLHSHGRRLPPARTHDPASGLRLHCRSQVSCPF